jgi:chaperonin GroES
VLILFFNIEIMAKKITPLGDRVVVEASAAEEPVSASGFVVASKEEENSRPQSGKILEIGPDVKGLSVGDEVIFKEFIPTSFDLDDQKFLILSEEDILAKIG